MSGLAGQEGTVLETLGLANEKSRKNEWIEAVELYKKALDFARPTGNQEQLERVTELLAIGYYRAAFQSESRMEFLERMKQAGMLYERVAESYRERGSEPLAIRFGSKALFAGFWLTENCGERRGIVEKCIALSARALSLVESAHDYEHASKIGSDILVYCREALHLSRDWNTRSREFERTIEVGRKVVRNAETSPNEEELISGLHAFLHVLAVYSEVVVEPSRFKGFAGEIKTLGKKLGESSQSVATPFALSLATEAAADISWNLNGDLGKARDLYLEALSLARRAGDSLAIGRLLAVLTGLQHWRAASEEYIAQRQEMIEETFRFAQEATLRLKIPVHTYYLARAYAFLATSCSDLAELVETDREKKKAQLSRAIEFSSEGLTYDVGTDGWYTAAHEKSKALLFRASITRGLDERKGLLSEALPIRKETVRVLDTLQPHSWNRGVSRSYLALTKAELAHDVTDPEEKGRLLTEAISDIQECIQLCKKWASTVPGSALRLARYSEWYGDILDQNYLNTSESDYSERAALAYADAIENCYTAKHLGPIPAIRWKIAKLFDMLGDFRRASEVFRKAEEEYDVSGSSIPGAMSAFRELSTYMAAWADIEEARLHHSEQEFNLAEEKYAQAAEFLASTKTWSYLSDLCTARSILEKGEGLSYEEKHGAAVEAFTKALGGFRKVRTDLEATASSTSDPRESEEVSDWIKIAEQREAFAYAKMELEEARAFDKKGEKKESSRKYLSASTAFKTLAKMPVSAHDRNEMTTLAQFCESWARMKEAETMASPDLFKAAAESFDRAQESTTNSTLRFLALANGSICRALEVGTRYRQTRNSELYPEIKRYLETASDFYLEGGFRKTGIWTRATKRLFDAIVLLTDAEAERDLAKKTELILTAERHLKLAAKLYGEAGFPRKEEEVLEYLERAMEEKEVLLAPLEVLGEIPTTSGVGVPSVPLARGRFLGLERFEDANVSGEIRPRAADVIVGADFAISLDMINVGKTAATLVKLENIVPEGLAAVALKGQPSLQGSSLDLRGKRLEYLKTCEAKISVHGSRIGTFDLSPRVVFVDEKGNYHSYEFRPSVLTVRERGLSELEGPLPPISIPPNVAFENERSRDVFRHLVKVFLDDYMSRRIVQDKAGWRTMMDIIEELRIPRSTFYGPDKRTGPVLLELERRGFVETRVFPGERGRGGDIKKIRVAFENTIVKRIVEEAVKQDV